MTDAFTNDSVPLHPLRSRWTVSGRVIVGLGGLWFVFALPSATNTSPGLFESFGLFVFGAAIGVAWFIATLLNRALCLRLLWWAVPAAPVLIILIFVSGWGLLVRMKLCEPELEAYVKEVGNNDQHQFDSHRVGLFRVSWFESSRGAVYLHTSNEWVDSTGIAYLPPGCQPHPGYQIINPIFGNWYRFYWDF